MCKPCEDVITTRQVKKKSTMKVQNKQDVITKWVIHFEVQLN